MFCCIINIQENRGNGLLIAMSKDVARISIIKPASVFRYFIRLRAAWQGTPHILYFAGPRAISRNFWHVRLVTNLHRPHIAAVCSTLLCNIEINCMVHHAHDMTIEMKLIKVAG